MSNNDNPLEKMTSLGDALPEQDEEKMEKKSDVPLKLTDSSVILSEKVSENVTLRARLSKPVAENQCIQAETDDGKFLPVYDRDSTYLPYVKDNQHRQLITLTNVRVDKPEGTTDNHDYINGNIIHVFDDGALPQNRTTKEHMDDTQFGVLRLENVRKNQKADKGEREYPVTRVVFSDKEGTEIRMLMWEPFLNDADGLFNSVGKDHFVVGASKLYYYRKEQVWTVNYNSSTIIQPVPDEDKKNDKDEKTACDGPAQPDKNEKTACDGPAQPDKNEKTACDGPAQSDVPLKLTDSSVIQRGKVSEEVTLRARLSKPVAENKCIQAETADKKFFPVYDRESTFLPYVEGNQHRQLITLTNVIVGIPKGTTDNHDYINGNIIHVFDDGALPQNRTTKEHMNDTQFGVLRLEKVLKGQKADKGERECPVTWVVFSDSEGTEIRMLMWEPFLNDADGLCTGEDHFVVGAGRVCEYQKERVWFCNYNSSTVIQQVQVPRNEKTACDGPAQPDKDENKGQK